MKKAVKITFWSILTLILLMGAALALFVHKITYGFPVSYETEKPTISFPPDQSAILVFSKTTGFRHGESIAASLPVFTDIGKRNGWFVYTTEEGGIFNPEQLRHFRAVVFNNSTGRVLNEAQQEALSQYVEQGGTLLGIHGAGDNSHHWDWYETHLLGTRFSHHPIHPQFQSTDVHEWYVFFNQPQNVHVLAYINGEQIIPNGNLLWVRDKDFGMGRYHPVAWYRTVGKGKTFYTSMGHSAAVWQDTHFVQLLENALLWTLQ
jgi:uncharacterized protein